MKIDKEETKRLGLKVMRTSTRPAAAAKKQKKDDTKKASESDRSEDFLRDE